jgi:hypothetical protein
LLKPAVLALSIGPLLSGCSTTGERIDAAAADLGRAQAGLALPELPAECRKEIAHAELIEGEDLAIILRRERGQLDKANAMLGRCAGFHDTLAEGLQR